MIKKNIVIIIILLFMFNSIVFAGDIPESFMSGDQKALFVGEIISIKDQKSIIKPVTIMMGEISEEEVIVDIFEKYYGTNEVPEVGDFIVAVLIADNEIDDLWIFKTTSSDYKTLKLVSESYGMVERYQEYINNGAYFEAQKELDEKREISIKTTGVENIDKNEESQEFIKVENTSNKRNYILIAIGILFLSILMVIVKVKGKKIYYTK